MVRGTVEETLNALLDAEADRLCNAPRYECSEVRQDSRAGSYERTLHTKAADVSLKRRESSVEEALINQSASQPGWILPG
jgi:transposase-like protein